MGLQFSWMDKDKKTKIMDKIIKKNDILKGIAHQEKKLVFT